VRRGFGVGIAVAVAVGFAVGIALPQRTIHTVPLRRSPLPLALLLLFSLTACGAAEANPPAAGEMPLAHAAGDDLTLSPPPISDADRKAARDLSVEAIDLQKAGRYADALERLQRALQLFPAPTILLHIAECQAHLGQLALATATYETLARQSLPDGSPPVFIAAQKQGAIELIELKQAKPSAPSP
jgi:tetratricopeptide (TPR) repeat protein